MPTKPRKRPTRKSESPAHPPIVSQAQWEKARQKLLVKEKAATRAQDALAAQRRRLPMVRIEKDYAFKGPDGDATLLGLFQGRRQLLLYHFMFAPGVGGWPKAGCPGCSLLMDNMGHVAHLNARDTSFAIVSLAPLKQTLPYKKRMGWKFPWYSSAGTTFNADFGLSTPQGENYAMSVFFRLGNEIFRTYFTRGRGVEPFVGTFGLLDLTPLGRQETWEDSPPGWPQTPPYQWWRRHDEY